MSLRMNLYGWSFDAFRQVLGSKDSAVLESASKRLTESLKEPELSKARGWLRTLLWDGFPPRQDRPPSAEPEDGGLLTVQMETESHVFAVYSIVRSIAQSPNVDLATESSDWTHSAVSSLYQDLSACGFSRSKDCPVRFHNWISQLSNGTALFGDDFRTQWSFYSWFTNHDLESVIPVLQAAAKFTRPVPEGYPEEARMKIPTGVSEDGKKYIADLLGWFGQLQTTGRDAFVLWW